jgi:hypothetical protein
MNYFVDITCSDTNNIIRTYKFYSAEQATTYVESYNSGGMWPGRYLAVNRTKEITAFNRVARMNTAFGNPKGDSESINWDKVRNQSKNIFDEYLELLKGLGLNDQDLAILSRAHKTATAFSKDFSNPPDVEAVRDALCDIQVFDMGAQHLMGYDGDRDMEDVVNGVMTRFIKSPADKFATQKLHAAKGVTDVYFEGEYPEMVMKSSVDQPDAPQGKFLKSASFKQTVFRAAP